MTTSNTFSNRNWSRYTSDSGCQTPAVPKGLHPKRHQELRPETFQKILAQFNNDFVQTLLAELFASIDFQPLNSSSTLNRVAHVDNAKKLTVDINRGAAFCSFRHSKFTFFPLILFQIALSVYFAFLIGSITVSFPVIELSYPCLALYVATVSLGWFIVFARYSFMCPSNTSASSATTGNKSEKSQPGRLTSTRSAGSSEQLAEDEIVESLSFRPDFCVPSWLPRLEIVWIFVLVVATCLNSHFLVDQAHAHPTLTHAQSPHRMADGMVVFSLLMPAFGYLVAKPLSFRHAALCWTISLVYNASLLSVHNLYLSKPILWIFATLSLFLLVELHRQDHVAFVLASNLQVALVENKWHSEESKSNELKHMLGNIAHDLKTVSCNGENGCCDCLFWLFGWFSFFM
jgi:hypothetical protein